MNSAYENEESIRKKKSLSKSSLTTISQHSTGQQLGDIEINWLSLQVTEDIKKLLNAAGNYARRTRDDCVRLTHIQHVTRTQCPDVLSRLLLFGKVLEEPVQTKAEIKSIQPSPKLQPKQLPDDDICASGILLPVSIPSHILISPDMPLNSTWLRQKRASWMRKERANIMPNKNFPLTKEQLDLYLTVTESCVGSSEAKRLIGLNALSKDHTVEVLMPKLSVFIADAVAVNVVEQNIIFLFYVMRMVKSLLLNPSLNFDKYLHLILPAVLSCLLTQQVSLSLGMTDHWSLREYSGSIATEIVRHYEFSESSLLPRVIGIYKEALLKTPLTTVYGAVIGLGKMGNDAVRACILPQLTYLSQRIGPYLEEPASVSLLTLAARFISHRLMKMCTPLLVRSSLEPLEAAYGLLGPMLRSAVIVSTLKTKAEKTARANETKLA